MATIHRLISDGFQTQLLQTSTEERFRLYNDFAEIRNRNLGDSKRFIQSMKETIVAKSGQNGASNLTRKVWLECFNSLLLNEVQQTALAIEKLINTRTGEILNQTKFVVSALKQCSDTVGRNEDDIDFALKRVAISYLELNDRLRQIEEIDDILAFFSLCKFVRKQLIPTSLRTAYLSLDKLFCFYPFNGVIFYLSWLAKNHPTEPFQICSDLKDSVSLCLTPKMVHILQRLSNGLDDLSRLTEIPQLLVADRRFHRYTCEETGKPIRVILKVKQEEHKAPIYFESCRILRLIQQRAILPRCWPTEIPFEEKFLESCPETQREIENHLQEDRWLVQKIQLVPIENIPKPFPMAI